MITKTSCLIRIFLRSLFIQSSFNFWRMQNLGFVFAVIPLIKSAGMDGIEASRVLNRHLQMFSTHPCLAGPVLGSVVKLEEETQDGREVEDLKKTLMGPYAAMGDAFFWGAWRPFAAIGGVVLMMEGVLWAPLLFLILYNPVPFYVRLKGFIEGYRRGRRGIDFVGGLHLPALAGKVRWMSVVLLGVLAAAISRNAGHACAVVPNLLMDILFSGVILLCFWMVTRGISTMKILYGTVALLLLLSF
ncbi:MAG: PTS system mannose/fructose/sorbose family transporter subunit IID [Syntrophales bacterium]|nr:PTS system mannose/fructose/sorbose family transporter subunit IID [Syntrophales bacterium]